MVDSGLDKLFAELEATFEASVAREEEAAAADLGFALAQTNRLQQVLPRLMHGVVLVEEGGSQPIAQIGSDYIATRPPVRIVPIARAVMRVSECGTAPSGTDANLLLTLRRLARQRARVEIETTAGQRRSGLLLTAGEDYVTLRETSSQIFMGLASLASIRVLGDSRTLGF